MAILHSLGHHAPTPDRGPLVAQTPVGASPLLLVIAILLVAALLWVLR